MSGLLQDLRYALRQLRNAGIRRRSFDYFADVPQIDPDRARYFPLGYSLSERTTM